MTVMPMPTTTPRRDAGEQTPVKHHPHRWRLNRAGIVNVWFYYDTEFTFSGGRVVLRGTNGSGKSRALEMLLPFVLDADRRKMDATGAGKVRLQDLMKAGGEGQGNRMGYLWLELARTDEDSGQEKYFTTGALVRFSHAAAEAKPWYFTTELRVGHDLELMSKSDRTVLSREKLTELVGTDRITDSPDAHRDRIRTTVFGLSGDSGRERFAGLLQLLHTLRSPDVGNRIEEGKLPQILSDSLPPLSETALDAAGEQLDGLSATREGQERLNRNHELVSTFLQTYRRYTAGVLATSCGTALDAASGVARATKHEADLLAEHEALTGKLAAAQNLQGELETRQGDLQGTLSGLKASSSYASARDLVERGHSVDTQARLADSALSAAAAARSTEADLVEAADDHAQDVIASAGAAAEALERARQHVHTAGLQPTLADTVAAHPHTEPAPTEPVRTNRDGEPVSQPRPTPIRLQLTPSDPDTAAAQALTVRDAVKARLDHSRSRLEHALTLEEQETKVVRAEERAGELLEASERAATDAAQAATDWQESAVTLATAWKQWSSSADTTRILGDADWSGPVARVLRDPAALTSDDGHALLTELDYAATRAADPARNRLSTQLAHLASADEAATLERSALETERSALERAVDPEPSRPSWLAEPEGVPLWRCVDFDDSLDAAARAGLEGALLSSGLLLATVDTDGTLRAGDGQLLVDGTGPAAPEPVTAVLRPDPASPVDADVIGAVLSRIGYRDTGHGVWVDADGSWANGPLRGRHQPGVARHVGAAARASARAARLAQIAADLDTLAEGAAERQARREALAQERKDVDAHVHTAPRSQPVLLAAATAERSAREADRAKRTAHEAKVQAEKDRLAWASKLADHRAACESFGLPAGSVALRAVQQDSQTALSSCEEAARALKDVSRRHGTHLSALAKTRAAVAKRHAAEQAAEQEWSRWHHEAAELAALRASVGAKAAQVLAEVAACEKELQDCTGQLSKAREDASNLKAEVSGAKVAAQGAAEATGRAQVALEHAAGLLVRRLQLPGVLAAAAPHAEPVQVSLDAVDDKSVRDLAGRVTEALGRFSPVDVNALMNARKPLDRDLAASYDVISEVHEDVHLFELADATGRKTIAAAADDLARQREAGQAALSEREHAVFTEFVLGGVADELRRRLSQAAALVDAMNTSLSTIKTSHGIGVKLKWVMAEGTAESVARIRELVSLAGQVRTPEQTRELTDLLKERVDEQFLSDASAGYATHLQAALDYRAWHRVEVIILGPAAGQERRISRRARLSQGETRFVSYVTLFAAVDAYLTGLPDTDRALRMLLLDDAFAKVDDRTIAELMGLLVRLDIDFAMTGHSLWGTYPQVPSVDCYEVRRHEGSSAVVTHVHWDGHNRHLRAAQ